jgi:hypothetical protein
MGGPKVSSGFGVDEVGGFWSRDSISSAVCCR